MRTILLCSGLIFSVVCLAQEKLYGVFPYKDNAIMYEKVVAADSATKQQLYSRVKNWALSFYNSQKDVLQLDNLETGIVAYKGFFSVPFTAPSYLGTKGESEKWQYWQTVKVLLKDNKAKIIVSDVTVKINNNTFPIEGYDTYIDNWKGFGKRYKDQYKEACYKNFKAADLEIMLMISSLEAALKTAIGKSDFDF